MRRYLAQNRVSRRQIGLFDPIQNAKPHPDGDCWTEVEGQWASLAQHIADPLTDGKPGIGLAEYSTSLHEGVHVVVSRVLTAVNNSSVTLSWERTGKAKTAERALEEALLARFGTFEPSGRFHTSPRGESSRACRWDSLSDTV